MRTGALACFVVLAAWVAEAQEWETVLSGPIVVKTRAIKGSDIKEVWGEGEIAAPVRDIQDTLMQPEHFPRFMPYVKEARTIATDPDGASIVYTRLELPWPISSRDYFSRVFLDQGVGPDGQGEFRNHWVADPDRRPARRNVVRLRVNEGSWHVVPKGDGSKSHAVYKFRSDPGGSIPATFADMGNKTGVSDTYKAVEQEAQRRAAERLAARSPSP